MTLRPLRALWPNVDAALGWIDGPGDPDRDGFVEYRRADEKGLVNQGWKDLHDAIFHADGSLAQGPIALCEVQGYVYLAKRLSGAGRSPARHGGTRATNSTFRLPKLAEQFEAAFWCADMGTYVLALAARSSHAACERPTRAMPVHRHRPAQPTRWWAA